MRSATLKQRSNEPTGGAGRESQGRVQAMGDERRCITVRLRQRLQQTRAAVRCDARAVVAVWRCELDASVGVGVGSGSGSWSCVVCRHAPGHGAAVSMQTSVCFVLQAQTFGRLEPHRFDSYLEGHDMYRRTCTDAAALQTQVVRTNLCGPGLQGIVTCACMHMYTIANRCRYLTIATRYCTVPVRLEAKKNSPI